MWDFTSNLARNIYPVGTGERANHGAAKFIACFRLMPKCKMCYILLLYVSKEWFLTL